MLWEADLIVWLQSISGNVLDYIFYAFTMFGDQIFFTIVLTALYWCFNKDFGYKFLSVFVFGASVLEVSKTIVQRPRPYVKYKGKIKSIIKDTSGFSFPSGHSHGIANLSTQILIYYKKHKYFYIFLFSSIFITLLVMFSRMYLGQHYFTDVIVGAVWGIVAAILFGYLYDFLSEYRYKFFYLILPISIILMIVLLCIDSSDLFYNTIKIIGLYSGFTLGYSLEHKYVGYNVKTDKKYKYLIRFLIGIIIGLLLSELLNLVFGLLPHGWFYIILNGYIRYFILALWVSLIAPLIFSKIRI